MFLAPIPLPKLTFKSPEKIRNSSIVKKFPVKFWRLVNSCKSNAVCWGLGGNSVRILRERFEEEYLFGENRPFKTETFSSFVRQLNLYGFRKVIRPVIINEHGQKLNTSLIEYKHPMFLKGHPELLPRIKRNTNSLRADGVEKNVRGGLDKIILKRKYEGKENYDNEISMQPAAKEGKIDGPVSYDVANRPEKPASFVSHMRPAITVVASQPPAPDGHSKKQIHGMVQHSTINPANKTMRLTIRTPSSASLSKPTQTEIHAGSSSSSQSVTANNNSDDLPGLKKIVTNQENEFQGVNASNVENEQTLTKKSEKNQANSHEPAEDIDYSNETAKLDQDTASSCARQVINARKIVKTASGKKIILPKTVGRIMVNGQQVVYLQPSPHNQGQPKQPVSNQTRPISIHPRQAFVFNIPKSAPHTAIKVTSLPLSSTCKQVATHPLLQPVRRESVPIAKSPSKSKTTTISFQRGNSSSLGSFTRLPNIPETGLLPENSKYEPPSSPDQDVLSGSDLADLMLFNLSSSLRDIEEPTAGNPADGETNVRSQIPRDSVPVSSDVEVHDSPKESAVASADKSVGVNYSESTTQTESPAETQTLHILNSKGTFDNSNFTGPRRELFKEKKTKRITIPLSGLPKDLFSPVQDMYKTDPSQAVVTIETGEDGKVTGHLIFRRNIKTEGAEGN